MKEPFDVYVQFSIANERKRYISLKRSNQALKMRFDELWIVKAIKPRFIQILIITLEMLMNIYSGSFYLMSF